jgi:thioredoxin 1
MTKTKEKHLLVFSAKWCGPCRMMKAHVWSDPTIEDKLKVFDSVNFVDIDDPKNQALAATYRIQGVPTIYIVDEKGAPLKAGSTMDINGTLNFLS